MAQECVSQGIPQEILQMYDTMKEEIKKMEAKMKENDERFYNVVERLERRLQKVEATLLLLGREDVNLEGNDLEVAGRPNTLKRLEIRVSNMEVAIQKAMESQFPHVEALVAQPEAQTTGVTDSTSQPPAPTSVPKGTTVPFSNASIPLATAVTPSIHHPTTDTPASLARRYILSRGLCEAAKYGELDDIQKQLDDGGDVNFPDVSGSTPLMRACQNGYIDVVSLLLERGADVHVKNKYGLTALHLATQFGHENIMLLLLQRNADIHAKDAKGLTALHGAALNNREMCMYELICAGANVDCRSNEGMTPLHYAAKWDQAAAVRMLLAVGASKTTLDNSGQMPLSYSSADSVKNLFEN